MKKTLSLVLMLVFALSCMSVFAEEDNFPFTDPNVTAPGTLPICKERVTVSIGVSQNSNIIDYYTNWSVQYVQDRCNVDIEWVLFPATDADAESKLDLMIASGAELPDVITFGLNDTTALKYGQAGVYIPLNKYYDNGGAAFLNARMEEVGQPNFLNYLTSPDGNIYVLGRNNSSFGNVVAYRAWLNMDWMKALDLEEPQTIDDLLDVLRHFRDDDPNGNGIADEIPMVSSAAGWAANAFAYILDMFDYYDSYGNYHVVEDGVLDVVYDRETYRDALRLAKQIPVAWVIVFSYVPMYSGLQIAFKQYSIRDGISGSPWIGIFNFEKFFSSYQFSRVLKNTIVLSLYSLVAGFPFPIILALGMNAMLNSKLKKTVQTITYIPHFISTVVLVGILLRVFNARIGIYGVLGMLFTGSYPADILGNANSFLHMYVWSGVWQNMGWGTIIYMAALSSVDPSLHEAAEIDGADRFKRVIHIDLPCILPTAIILLIMDAGHIMSVGFEKVYLMQNNLNLQMSEVISTYVYKVGIAAGGGDFPYATAIGLFNSFVNLTILLLVNSISRKVSETSLW